LGRKKVKRGLFVIIVLLFLINAVLPQDFKLAPPVKGMYQGAFPNMGATEDSVTKERILAFDSLTGNPVVWVYFSNNWFKGIKFPKTEVEVISSLNKIPFIRIMPRSGFINGSQDPVYTLQKITDGVFDEELTQYARDAKNIKTGLIMEFGTEVNGSWFSWNGKYNGGGNKKEYGDPKKYDGPERFRDAYRHIIDIFRNEGAKNVTWVYHVNSNSVPKKKWNTMQAYYPGDDYIDWIGASIYGAQVPGERGKEFTDIMDECYDEICNVSKNKPLAVLEFGVIEDPAVVNKPEWIGNALQSLINERYPRIKAISYWNSKWQNENGRISDMRLDSSPESIETFKKLINDAFFKPEVVLIK
jgi:hypothetical protein